MNELHDAIAAGDEDKVKSLVANPACNVNQPHSETGEMPLAMALRMKNTNIITKLLYRDATFTAHLAGTRSVRVSTAKSLLQKAEKAVNDLSEDSYLFNLLRVQVAYELAMMHKVSRDFDDSISQIQQAIAFLGFIPADKQDLYYFNRLFVLNAECFLIYSEKKKKYPKAIPFFRAAEVNAQDIFRLEQNSLVLKPTLLSLAQLFKLYGVCQFKRLDLDASIDGHLSAFQIMLRIDVTQRDAEFFHLVDEIFKSMGRHVSITDYDFYHFFALAFRENEVQEEEEEEERDAVISEFTRLTGALTSQSGMHHHRPHLIQTTIEVMQLLLDSYTNEHFPNTVFKEFLSDDDNRRLFEAKLAQLLAQLRAFKPLRVLTAASPATMEAVVRRIGLLELENKALKARVAELEKELPRPIAAELEEELPRPVATAPTADTSQPPADPTLFGGSLKRPRDTEAANARTDITPQEEKKDEPPSKKPRTE